MLAKQVTFKDEEENNCFGIQIEVSDSEKYIICACCGTIFEEEDVHDIKPLGEWLNFSDFMC